MNKELIEIFHDPGWEERTYKYRGKIIAHFAFFEKALETFLAAEFSTIQKDRHKMQSIIFDRMTFESKRTSIRTVLLSREIDQGFTKTKSNSHPHKKLLEELTSLNALRNQFAHYPTIQATNEKEYSYAIGLMEYRDSPNFKWFTEREIEDIIKRIADAQKDILKLTRRKSA